MKLGLAHLLAAFLLTVTAACKLPGRTTDADAGAVEPVASAAPVESAAPVVSAAPSAKHTGGATPTKHAGGGAPAADAPCPGPGLTRRCGGHCVNIQTDDANCGSCGNHCQSGKHCDGHMFCRDSAGNL
jgi:transcription elongation factor